MRRYFLYSLLFSGFFSFQFESKAQDLSLYQKKWMVQGGDTLPYRILYPLNYDSTKNYPVIFFLHGAGERGSNNEAQLIHGAKLFLQEGVRTAFPAFVIFPQCGQDSYWSNVLRLHDTTRDRRFVFLPDGPPTKYMQLLMQLVQFELQDLRVKKDQVYVGGLSMGGMGTYELVRRMPHTFAAAFAICGGANPVTAKQLTSTAWWLFHGLKDNVVDPQFSRQMAAALKAQGANVRLTLYPEANHNSWDSAFAEKDLLPWLFSHHKRNANQ